jgi:alanine racemase
MTTGTLTIDLTAVAANWQALDAMTACETAAVVKADGYGLGAAKVARALARAGAQRFFVAVAEEGAAIREALGPNAEICVFGGHMAGDTDMIADLALVPMLNSIDQLTRHFEALPGHPFGVQLDTGMNRLGMEEAEWAAVARTALAKGPRLVMSHLACADEPDHPMNAAQLQQFRHLTDGITVPRSLAATGGILLGPEYHFDLTRPGIGLYGGLPFDAAHAVAHLDLPVIQTRELATGETAGYGNSWTAQRPSRLATVSAGYADGLHRLLSNNTYLWAEDIACPLVGRVSMDLITVDITDLADTPRSLSILTANQTVDTLAEASDTIGYEVLTALGPRYRRRYVTA